MEGKRKRVSRASTRLEPPSKKRTATPPEPPPAAPSPVQVVEEPLPKSIQSGKPLPTVSEPQPEDLPAREYQSVEESGVLAESLRRSRHKLLHEGVFEKYWTKPLKRKGPEDPKNPAKDTMTKIGTCTITIEPHIFDATMYAVKAPISQHPAPSPQQPIYRPIIQYGPPNGVMPPPQAPTPPQRQFLQMQPGPQATPRPNEPAIKNSPSPAPSMLPPNGSPHVKGNGVLPAAQTQPPTTPASHLPPNGHQISPSPNPTPPPPASTSKSSDPVIQMLAERASTDHDLKALMRIVADGEASTDQLTRFQGHIDELTRLLAARQASQPPSAATPPLHTTVNGGHKPSAVPNVRTTPAPVAPTNHIQPQPQALRSKGPVAPTKPDISGVVFEFAGGLGDRYSFPKYSILEYLPGGQVIASFLIVRKGSSSDSTHYDPELDYYQPVTIRLYAHQGRQLDALAKVVAPRDEVLRYMDDIMDNTTRAEYVLLAMRLPREPDHAPKDDGEAGKRNILQDNKVLWTATNDTPERVVSKTHKKPMDEQAQYQSYVTSVSAQVV